jgi:hypothetical protein
LKIGIRSAEANTYWRHKKGAFLISTKAQPGIGANLYKVVVPRVRFIFSRSVIRRNLFISLIVGCVLSGANQYDVIARASFTAKLGMKIFFNFLIPFIVSSASAAANRSDD